MNKTRIKVINKSHNNNMKTLQKFKNKVNDEGILLDLKKHEYYVKPSKAKILKRENAERQRAKDLRKEIRNLEKMQMNYFFSL